MLTLPAAARAPPLLIALAVLLAAGDGALAVTADDINRAGIPRQFTRRSTKPIPSIAKAQTLLARSGISPGEIDGKNGENYRKAIVQFRHRERLGEGDVIDAATWSALGGDTTSDIVIEYTLAKPDTAYVFSKRIPRDYAKQARMKRLSYKSAPEMIAERFHMGEPLLKALNPRARYGKTGEKLLVVSPARPRPAATIEFIEANKRTGMVTAFGAGNVIVASYPATIGSADMPSPQGEFEVERVVKNPTYHYDPEKNFQQGRNTRRLILPRGPNNPVGTVWIGLSKPTFGIHGTPTPSQVSKTSSHGCARLTNWDAEELAELARPGVPVRFVD
jgi:lipoprotein-anchoring transpeptidase ErfK/SrfK